MAEQDLDRSEAATPFKLKKARDQGQVARSADLTAAVVFASAMAWLDWQGPHSAIDLLRLARNALAFASTVPASEAAWWSLLQRLLLEAGAVLLPFLLCLAAVAALACFAQTGPVFSVQPLKMDVDRINPASGLRRLFSLRTLFDGLRACVKLVLLAALACMVLQGLVPRLPALARLSPPAFLRACLHHAADLGMKLALAMLLIGLFDFAWTRRSFLQRMRMSRRDLRDEVKNREGDARIRARMRALRRELLQRTLALRQTRHASVILTNPTHYAVALRYVHGEMDAPVLVAKGAGHLAAAMRAIAWRNRIPIVRKPSLTRRLFKAMDLQQAVPPSFHAEVARIIVWVLAMQEHAGAR